MSKTKWLLVVGLILSISLFGMADENLTAIVTPDASEVNSESTESDLEEGEKENIDTTSEAEDNSQPEVKEDEIIISATDEVTGDDKKVQIKGDVNIRGTNFTATGAVAEIDLENNIVYFAGGVTVNDSDRQFTGEELIYNYKTKAGTIKGVTGNIDNEKFKDDIYLYGQTMSFEDKYMRLEGGRITTCNLDKPHYHIAAKVIEVYEDDKIVLRSLYYKEGNLPLLYFPYWQISLKEKKNYWKFPKFGSSYKEGFFVKLAYVYTLNDYNKGEINFDYMTKLGIGQGIQHAYSKDKVSANGRYYLIYTPRENKLNLIDTSGSFNINQEKFKLSGNAAYIDDYTELTPKYLRKTDFGYNFGGQVYSGSLKFSYSDEQSASLDREEFKLESNQTINFNKAWRANLSANFSRYQKQNQPWINVLSYDGTLSYTAKYLSGTLRWQREDKSQEENTTYSKLFRQPEVIIRTRNVKVITWPLTLETTIGHYLEEPKKIESDRLGFRATLGRKTYKLTKNLDFSMLGEGQGTIYNLTVFNPYMLSGRMDLGLSYTPVKNWRFQIDYSKRNVYGNSPFNFDRMSKSNSVDFKISNTLGPVTTDTKTGYDLIKSQLKDWENTHKISYGNVTASLEHNYKLQPFEAIKVAGNIKVEPTKDMYLQGRFNYTKEKSQWQLKELNGKGEIKFGLYNLFGEATYNPQTNKYTTLKVALGRDFHCRRVDLSYDHVNKAVWVEYRINAVGDKPMKVKMSGSGMEFSADMLSALSSGN